MLRYGDVGSIFFKYAMRRMNKSNAMMIRLPLPSSGSASACTTDRTPLLTWRGRSVPASAEMQQRLQRRQRMQDRSSIPLLHGLAVPGFVDDLDHPSAGTPDLKNATAPSPTSESAGWCSDFATSSASASSTAGT